MKCVPMPSCMPASSRACLDMSYTTISVAEMMELRSRFGKYLRMPFDETKMLWTPSDGSPKAAGERTALAVGRVQNTADRGEGGGAAPAIQAPNEAVLGQDLPVSVYGAAVHGPCHTGAAQTLRSRKLACHRAPLRLGLQAHLQPAASQPECLCATPGCQLRCCMPAGQAAECRQLQPVTAMLDRALWWVGVRTGVEMGREQAWMAGLRLDSY